MSTHVRHLRGLTIATAVMVTAALILVFFYAPLDANQGFVQKIFYIHVPLAIISAVIWAKASWGHWWLWSEPTLVSYLIVILLFCTYQPLRFSIEDPERQARYAAVFAIFCGAFVPINFVVVRLAGQFIHPQVLNLEGGNLPGSMKLAFYTSLVAIALLFTTLMKYEMASKMTRIETRRLRRRVLGDDALRPLGRSAAPQ